MRGGTLWWLHILSAWFRAKRPYVGPVAAKPLGVLLLFSEPFPAVTLGFTMNPISKSLYQRGHSLLFVFLLKHPGRPSRTGLQKHSEPAN